MKKKNSMRHLTLVTLIAFLANVMLPFFAVYNIPPASATELEQSSDDQEKILICTQDGFKWASLKELQENEDQPSHSQYECAMCYITAQGLQYAFPAQEVTLTFLHNTQYTPYFFTDIILTDPLALNGFLTRAPPFLV